MASCSSVSVSVSVHGIYRMLHVGHGPDDCTTNRAIACKLDMSQHIKHPPVGLIIDVTAKTVNTTACWPIMLRSTAPNMAELKNRIEAL